MVRHFWERTEYQDLTSVARAWRANDIFHQLFPDFLIHSSAAPGTRSGLNSWV
jgi:hypothetical protein